MYRVFCRVVTALVVLIHIPAFAQDDPGRIEGNFQVGSQLYFNDTVAKESHNAIAPEERVAFNSWMNLIYTKGNFSSGIRLESYEPRFLGYPANPNTAYEGTGLGYRYARYTGEGMTVTVGNFYDQFGSGLTFRAYEERNLGVDNAIDGIHMRYEPVRGVILKGLYGKQRLGFVDKVIKGPGIVRGVDAEVSLNDLLDSAFTSPTRITIGGSFVTRYQEDLNATLVLPLNVATYGGRININRGRINFLTEYAYKINDPSSDNGFIYRSGQALLVNTTYSKKGLGITLGGQFIDNMSFRSDRNAALADLLINYVPAVPRQHTYNLPATLYPYATQLNGEVGFTGEIMYKFNKDTPLGGKYGTTVSLNSAIVKGIDTTQIGDFGEFDLREGYSTNIFSFAGRTFFRDVHLEVNKKFSKDFKANFMFINFVYNKRVLVQKLEPNVGNLIGIVDANYKISSKHAIRFELQGMMVGNFLMKDEAGDFQSFEIDKELDFGHWMTFLAEYTYSPHWFFALQDQYNFGNDHGKALHYPLVSFGYTEGVTRIMITGGRQRQGLFCVGGVCRQVPASTGVSLTVTGSF